MLLVVLSQFPLDVFENAGAFKQLEVKDGFTLSERDVKGSAYQEYRVETPTALPIEALCSATFEWGTKGGDSPGLTLNKVLRDGDDLRVVYNQIVQPVVSKRDFAMSVARERLTDGNCRIRFRVTNEQAPPKPEDFIRMDKLWGEWRFEAVPSGGAKMIYTMFSDPAGAVPPFLVRGVQKNAAMESARTALAKTKKLLEAGK